MLLRLPLPIAAFLAVLLLLPTTPASAAAPPPIGPGVQMITAGRICTANFVFKDARGRSYLGYAARCAARAGVGNGCVPRSRALGTPVRFATGASSRSRGRTLGWGKLRYSSWTAMRRAGTRDATLCSTNDFALVRVDRGYRHRVAAAFPFWGGPTGLAGVPAAGASVFTVGRSPGRAATLSPKSGTVQSGDAWQARIDLPLPGIRGDIGSGVLDDQGRAFGVVSAVGTGPGGTLVGGLEPQLAFARSHGRPRLRLVLSAEPFSQSTIY